MIIIKRGDIVHFKLAKASPLMTGEVHTIGKDIVWVKSLRLKGKPMEHTNKFAVDRRNIYL